MLDRFERLDDMQWLKIAKAIRAANGNLSKNTRDHVDGILFLMQFDLPWRSLDPSFGKWNSVYTRFMRWSERDVLNNLVRVFKEMGLTQRWNTNWVEYSRSTGAKLSPSLRAVVSSKAVDKPSRAKNRKTRSKNQVSRSVDQPPLAASVPILPSEPAHQKPRPNGQMILATLRARRDRRKALGIRY